MGRESIERQRQAYLESLPKWEMGRQDLAELMNAAQAPAQEQGK